MHSISIHGSINDLSNEEVALLNQDQSTPFCCTDWYGVFEAHVALTLGKVQYVVLKQGESPVEILPLILITDKGVRITSLTNYYSPYYQIPYRNGNYQGLILKLLKLYLETLPKWDEIDLGPFVETDLILSFVRGGSFSPLGKSFTYYKTHNWYCDVDTYDDFISNRPKTLRNTLKRKSKKFSAGAENRIEIITKEEALDARIIDFFEVYNNSWKKSEPYQGFIKALIKLAHIKGWLRFGFAYKEDRPIAAQLWLVVGDCAYIYKLAYDEDYKPLSAGTILTNTLCQHVIEKDGVRKIDYLTGNDPYKSTWMDSSRKMYGITIINTASIRGRITYLRNLLSKLRIFSKQQLSISDKSN